MTTPTYFWYDYETSGLDTRCDRPLQFAGRRTDLDMNPIGEPIVLFCKPAIDALPNPGAALVTGILPQALEEKGLPESEFCQRILAELAAPGTIRIGYNTVKFDEEVTRNLLWRCVRDPYGWENANGCARWDTIDTVRLTWALRPEGIEWPLGDEGRPTFRLDHLTVANGIEHANAHDAMADVDATVAVARLIRARQPQFWNFLYAQRFDPAKSVSSLVARAQSEGVLILWRGFRSGSPLGAYLPVSAGASRELALWDLSHDPSELLNATREQLETGTLEGLRRINAKKCPPAVFLRHPEQLSKLLGGHTDRFDADIGECFARADALRARMDRCCDITRTPRKWDAEGASDPEATLYSGGFPGPADKRRRIDLAASLLDAGKLAAAPRFDDARLNELLLRYRARNFPESLTGSERAQWAAHVRERLEEGVPGWLTIQQYQDAIDAEMEKHPEDAQAEELLGALYEWSETCAERLEALGQ